MYHKYSLWNLKVLLVLFFSAIRLFKLYIASMRMQELNTEFGWDCSSMSCNANVKTKDSGFPFPCNEYAESFSHVTVRNKSDLYKTIGLTNILSYLIILIFGCIRPFSC